ncbi:MAG: UvrD-helicase domain-containing protein [Candidatus Diapherotrites archaeon]|uniref:DNA 3'-5' helicase n=1 Tax=Candidatus Iainarchaeum sp. TaxID=3101447 RepID=A0A8T3YJV8_9ARCH|nr:UvrD-helicase domain-containing protein [Candidatus Diapherotrites archaeon]
MQPWIFHPLEGMEHGLSARLSSWSSEIESAREEMRMAKDYFTSDKMEKLRKSLSSKRGMMPVARMAATLSGLLRAASGKRLKDECERISSLSEKALKELEAYNETFIRKQMEKHGALLSSGIALDDSQKRAVITCDRHNLVIAGAGAGKTEVLTKRIAYIASENGLRCERVLALAFQRKAAAEISRRLAQNFGISTNVRTFHSFGNDILGQCGIAHELICRGGDYDKCMAGIISGIFAKSAGSEPFCTHLADFMACCQDGAGTGKWPGAAEKSHGGSRGTLYRTLDGRQVRSEAEREIYNFFFTHTLNGKRIDFRYEEPARWMKYTKESGEKPAPDFFFPEHGIYLEHWATDSEGAVPGWFTVSSEEYDRERRLKKKEFGCQHRYTLIETFHHEYACGKLRDALKGRFIAALRQKNPGTEYTLEKIPHETAMGMAWENMRETAMHLPKAIAAFIQTAKAYGRTPGTIEGELETRRLSRMQASFARMAVKVYNDYEQGLAQTGTIDFNDMINKAIWLLKSDATLLRGAYDHIFVDEYQDINAQRFTLLKLLMDRNPECRLFCVGDDWQSIMGFTGASTRYFTGFAAHFPNPAITRLKVNYRSARPIVDAGNAIIAHNPPGSQIPKQLEAMTDTTGRVTVRLLPRTIRMDQYYREAAKECIREIRRLLDSGTREDEIIVLYRIRKPQTLGPLRRHAKANNIQLDFSRAWHGGVRCMTVHQSKGLEARKVLILNADNGLFGFPCELENPTLIEPAKPESAEPRPREEEERRLFYVAITRAKEEATLFAMKGTASKFIEEIRPFVEETEVKADY